MGGSGSRGCTRCHLASSPGFWLIYNCRLISQTERAAPGWQRAATAVTVITVPLAHILLRESLLSSSFCLIIVPFAIPLPLLCHPSLFSCLPLNRFSFFLQPDEQANNPSIIILAADTWGKEKEGEIERQREREGERKPEGA